MATRLSPIPVKQAAMKGSGRGLLPKDASSLLAAERIASKIGAGVGSGGGHQLIPDCLSVKPRFIRKITYDRAGAVLTIQ